MQLLTVTNKHPRMLAHKMKLGRLVAHPFYRGASRLKYKPDFFHHHLMSEFIPDLLKIERTPLSWEECCFQRAKCLFLETTGPVFLLWSGGIDSSVALMSILACATKADLKRFKIILSHHSVLENPGLYQRFVSKFPYINVLSNFSDLLQNQPDSILVTGELGDQLFGSDILLPACEKLGESILHECYESAVPKIIECDPLLEGLGKTLFERLHPIVEESPIPIRTAHDFFWWWNFSQKWQHVKYRIYHQITWPMNLTYEKSVRHFFDSVDFQLWSLNNHDLKIQKSWESYKYAAKKFLFDQTGDQNQLKLKKIQSLEKTYLVSENRIAITENLEVLLTLNELLEYAVDK